MGEDITTDPADIKNKIKKYNKQFYTQKLNNLDEITNTSKSKLTKLTKD